MSKDPQYYFDYAERFKDLVSAHADVEIQPITQEALDELAQAMVDMGVGNHVTVITANPVCPMCDEGVDRCRCDKG